MMQNNFNLLQLLSSFSINVGFEAYLSKWLELLTPKPGFNFISISLLITLNSKPL